MNRYRKFVALSDEIYDISSISGSHANAVSRERDVYGQDDIEMQPSSMPADGEINSRSDLDVK